ncbi:MAG: hypothetical protein IKY18_03660 [Oscillospiraceae bacterium]|nr:hypothetical protein [Oscillospiraceae bacterium]
MNSNKYIYWRLMTEKVSRTEFLEIEKKIKAEGTEMKSEYKSRWADWKAAPVNYRKERRGAYETLYVTRKDSEGFWYARAYTSKIFEDAAEDKMAGWKAHEIFQGVFEAKNGVTMRSAYGVVPASVFRRFTPKTPYYTVGAGIYADVNMADFSSHFPANARGLLPDAHTQKEEDGRVEPTNEWPFAFYLHSGHVAQYGVFDTHEWVDKKKNTATSRCVALDKQGQPVYNDIKDAAEKTILMKASKYEMTAAFEELYRLKYNGNEEAKAAMNMAIGTFHKNPRHAGAEDAYDYYHVAAVLLCRSNETMRQKIMEIENDGGIILMVVVDGVAWVFSPGHTEPMALGAFVEKCRGAILNTSGKINNYEIRTPDGELIKEAHAGKSATK